MEKERAWLLGAGAVGYSESGGRGVSARCDTSLDKRRNNSTVIGSIIWYGYTVGFLPSVVLTVDADG